MVPFVSSANNFGADVDEDNCNTEKSNTQAKPVKR